MRVLLIIITILSLNACMKSPEPTLFVLDAMPTNTKAISSKAFILDNLRIPEYVDRNDFFIFSSEKSGSLSSLYQWAMSLKANIQQVITTNFQQLAPHSPLTFDEMNPSNAIKVNLDITTLKIFNDGHILLNATYEIYGRKTIKRSLQFKTTYEQNNLKSCVEALNIILGKLSRNIVLNYR